MRWREAFARVGKRRNLRAAAAVLVGAAGLASVLYLSTRVKLASPEELAQDVLPLLPEERSIVLVGDVMPWDRAAPYLEQHGAVYPFRATLPLLRSAGLTVLNLEGPVAERSPKGTAEFSYRIPPWTLAGMVEAGFDAVNLANNHALDCGPEGMRETLEFLSSAKLASFGAGREPDEAYSPRIVGLGGLRIALIGGVAPETTHLDSSAARADPGDRAAAETLQHSLGVEPGRPGVAVLTRTSLLQALEKARAMADLVLLFVHWGIRYEQTPTAYQREIAHAAIDAGVDLVVGHHAHTWQPVETYANRAIAYGLGNFAFGSGNRRAREALAVRAVVRGTQVTRLELYPLYTMNRDCRVSYQPRAMAGRSARALLERLAKESRPLGASVEVVGGHAVMRLP